MRTLIINIVFLFCMPSEGCVRKNVRLQDTSIRNSKSDTCINFVCTESSYGYLIKPDYKSLILNGLGYYRDFGLWELADSIIIEFEDSLQNCIGRNQIDIFAKDPKKYLRQYSGIKDSTRNVLLINFYYADLTDFKSIKNNCIIPFSENLTRWRWEKYGYDFMMLYFIDNKKIVIWNDSIPKGW